MKIPTANTDPGPHPPPVTKYVGKGPDMRRAQDPGFLARSSWIWSQDFNSIENASFPHVLEHVFGQT